MRKSFFVLSTFLFYAGITFAQADLDLTLTFTTDETPPYNVHHVNFGLDSSATDGIDPQLGEIEIPPDGCGAWGFTSCFAFFLPENNFNSIAVWNDYRFGTLPFTGMKEHRIAMSLADSATQAVISWNFPPGVFVNIKDMFGGIFLDIDLYGTGSYLLTNSIIVYPRFKLLVNYLNVGGDPEDPIFSISDSTLTFPSIAIGDSISLPVSITNLGYVDSLNLSDVISSNPNFTISSDLTQFSIPPLSTRVLNIVYHSVPEAQNGIISIFHNALNSPFHLNVMAPISQPKYFGVIYVSSGTSNHQLLFGIHPLASDGIDPLLDEHNLPPPPPPGAFDSRLIFPANNFSGTESSYKDYRLGQPPFSGQKEFRLAYQPNLSNNVTINWNLSIGMTGTLQDIINGTFINVPISDSGSFVVSDPINFNKLKMLIDFNIHTPVELISFHGIQSGSSVVLDWLTGSEINNKCFEVERLVYKNEDLNNWVKIGSIDGNGTTTETHKYSFKDEDLSDGKVKYRLKQFDFDGTFSYSNEIDVNLIPKEFILHQNYPNPFNPTTNIEFTIPLKSQIKINVYNILGELIQTIANGLFEPGLHVIVFNAENLPSGIYIYQMETELSTQSRTMILLK